MVTRTPKKNIRELLRKEVNFGCPVDGCGSPYLTWHHFEPQWSEREHHDPEGMIALCIRCHPLADGDRWTSEQLREMKSDPYVKYSEISDTYGYLRVSFETLVGNVASNVKNVLVINDERVIGFEKDDKGYNRLNIRIKDRYGKIILEMENNDWTVFTSEIFDLICTAQGKELSVISKDKDINFHIKYRKYTIRKYKQLIYKRAKLARKNLIKYIRQTRPNTPHRDYTIKILESMDPLQDAKEYTNSLSDNEINTLNVNGRIKYLNEYIEITDNEIIDLNSKSHFSMNFVMNQDTAFNFSHGGVKM